MQITFRLLRGSDTWKVYTACKVVYSLINNTNMRNVLHVCFLFVSWVEGRCVHVRSMFIVCLPIADIGLYMHVLAGYQNDQLCS